jgi:tetratricopeptide (TPR) repeat protein
VTALNTNVLAEPILVGREHELKKLQALLNSAVAGKGTTVFVSGEAGAGKTRLVTEFLNQARKQAVTVLTGWCLSNAAVPYFPFFEAFSSYFSAEHGERVVLKDWLMGPSQTDKFGNPQTITPQVWKDQTFTAVANTLSSISAKKPIILFIDDLHWADSASLALLHYLGRIANSGRVLIIATFRMEQLASDAEGRPHPLVETLRLMRREDLAEEIRVASLKQPGIWELAKEMLGGDLQLGFAQKLANESQGNPLFVVESIRMLHEQNALTQEHEQWRLVSGTIGIPPKIKDVILQRLSTLSRGQRHVLELASVVGEKFDASLLASALGQERIGLIRLLDTVAEDTSLVVCEGESYKFDHSRTRDAVYGDISSPLKKVYHAKVAEELETNCKGDTIPSSDLAYHYSQAGNKRKAVEYSLAAGQDALTKWSNSEAIKHFSFVVQAIKEETEFTKQKLAALEGLGDAYFASDNLLQAVTTFEQLTDFQSGAAKDRATRKAAEAAIYLGDIAHQKALIQKAEAITATDRLEAARVLHPRVFLIESPSDWVIARRTGEQILRVFEEEYALSDAAQVLRWIGYGQAMLGALEMGVESALRSISLLDELGDFRSQIESYAYAGGTLQACTFDEEANRMFAKAVEVNEKYKIWDYVRLFPAYVWEAMGLVGQDTPSAIIKALKALEYFKKTDSSLYAGAVYGVLIVAHALAEDINHVEEYFEKLMSLPKDILSNAPTQIYIAPTTAIYYAARNEFEKSNKIFTDWLAAIKSVFPSPFYEAGSRQLYAWSLGRQGRMEEAKTQLEKAQKIAETARSRFGRVKIAPSLMSLTRLEASQSFPIRLDLVNISVKEGSIVKVENLPQELKILEISPNCILHDGQIEFKDNKIKPFEVKTIKLTLKAPEAGSFELNPQITYIDDSGEKRICNPRPLAASVKPAQPESKVLAGGISDLITVDEKVKPFDVFLCYKRTSGKDFADHLKIGLEELGFHTFIDTKDIPKMVVGEEEWAKTRDKALEESRFFILIMTPGFELSSEVIKELNLARKQAGKTFIYFCHSNTATKVVIRLENEVLDIGKQEQVFFETKEELLRLAHDILIKRPHYEPSKDRNPESDAEIDIVKKFGLPRSTGRQNK